MSVIGQNKRLLWFPLITAILTCVIALFFLSPAVLWDTGHTLMESSHWKTLAGRYFILGEKGEMRGFTSIGFAYMAVVYLVSVFGATFFNVAFYHEILSALNGNPVSIKRGLHVACSKVKSILMWSLFTGIVGILIKMLEDRLHWVGRWIAKLIGIAWSVASVFVVPVIIREETGANPVTFLKNSALMLKRTWGESLIGYVGIRFISVLCMLGSLLIFAVPLGVAIVLRNVWLMVAVVVLEFICLMIIGYLIHVASQVYRCALYVYASEGVTPGPFDEQMMNMAWKVKSGRTPLH
jgi:hypothetical protein